MFMALLGGGAAALATALALRGVGYSRIASCGVIGGFVLMAVLDTAFS